MSNAVMPLSDYKNTCDKIREKTASTDNIKSGELADKVSEVYEKGKQAELDNLWGVLQDYGRLKNYTYAFGTGWNEENFKPKYDFKILSMYGMFYHFGSYTENGKIYNGFDFIGCLDKAGVKLDMSETNDVTCAFMYCKIAKLPPLDFRNLTKTQLQDTFRESYTTTVEITLRDDGANTFNANCFWCERLTDIIIHGVIGNTITFYRCTKLSKASTQNIISCLSSTASGMTLTLSTTAVNNAFETASGMADGSTSGEWLNLVATKPNWTISLS